MVWNSAIIGSYEFLMFFADMGTDIHLKSNNGLNCLHIAAGKGHLSLCKALVEKHYFDVHIVDNDGWTALHHSAMSGKYDVVEFFQSMGTNVYIKTNEGLNCLHISARYGHLDLCKRLIEKQKFDVRIVDNDGWTALHHSARSGKYDVLEFFASMETNIHIKTNEGLNCLHISARYGHLDLCKRLIYKHKFDIHMADKYGWTALHESAKNDSYELVTFFANMGADIHLETKNGWNCLKIAGVHENFKLYKALLGKPDFEIYFKDNNRWRTLHHSARSGQCKMVEK